MRDDFGPDSDVDVLVTFDENATWSLEDRLYMKDELQEMFGREVDLVSKKGLRNPFRRHAILTGKKVLLCSLMNGMPDICGICRRRQRVPESSHPA